MKVLLDECLPVRLRPLLLGHAVFTVGYLGWKGTANGRLLAAAAADGFQAIITSDRAVEQEQDPRRLPLHVVIVHARSNSIDDIRPMVGPILASLAALPPLPRVVHVRR